MGGSTYKHDINSSCLVSSACAVSVCTLTGQLSVTLHVLNSVFGLQYTCYRFSQPLHARVTLINCMHREGETYCKYPVQLTSLNKKGEARTQFSSSVNNSGIPCLHFDRTLLAQFLKSVETDPFFSTKRGRGTDTILKQ